MVSPVCFWERHGIPAVPLFCGVQVVRLKKTSLFSSLFVIFSVIPVLADTPIEVPANEFPNAMAGQYMLPNRIYINSAKAENMDGVSAGVVFAVPQFENVELTCSAGQYLPANASACVTCPADSYCVGGSFDYPIANAQGIASCPSGKIAPAGSDAESDCRLPSLTCSAGQYLPANASACVTCPADSYCVGGSFDYPIANAQGIASCPSGKVSPVGTTFAGGCGKVMHVGEDVLYLTSERQTLPALAVKFDGVVYYARMTSLAYGAKSMNAATTKSLRTKIGSVEYSIHDNTVQGE